MWHWRWYRQARDWRQLEQARQRNRALPGAAQTAPKHLLNAWHDNLNTPLPSPEQHLQQLNFLAIDIETSGLDPTQDEMISIAWIPLSAALTVSPAAPNMSCLRIELAHARHEILRAQQKVGQSATIHGIRDCDRHQGVGLANTLTEFFQALSGRWPIFHHAPLDLGFLHQALSRWGLCWPSLYWDTLLWQQQRRLQRQEHIAPSELQLGQARRYYHLPSRQAHDALDDALSCAELFLVLAAQSRARVADTYQLNLN